MNGLQIERVLELIDSNIDTHREGLHTEILAYLVANGERLAREISEKGYGEIPTRFGLVRISREDVEAAAAA